MLSKTVNHGLWMNTAMILNDKCSCRVSCRSPPATQILQSDPPILSSRQDVDVQNEACLNIIGIFVTPSECTDSVSVTTEVISHIALAPFCS